MAQIINAYIATCFSAVAIALLDAKLRSMIARKMEEKEEPCKSSAEYRYRRWLETMEARNKEVK